MDKKVLEEEKALELGMQRTAGENWRPRRELSPYGFHPFHYVVGEISS